MKVSTLRDLNDPFEFIGQTFQDPRQQLVWHSASKSMFEKNGLISFSKSWNNPVLWSHYADKHHGIVLGFDVNDEFVRSVNYQLDRPQLPDITKMSFKEQFNAIELATRTKFDHWSYEQEFRIFVNLNDIEDGLFFKEFDSDMNLTEIIIGVRCEKSSKDLKSHLGKKDRVKITTARLAFKSYSMVKQKKREI